MKAQVVWHDGNWEVRDGTTVLAFASVVDAWAYTRKEGFWQRLWKAVT